MCYLATHVSILIIKATEFHCIKAIGTIHTGQLKNHRENFVKRQQFFIYS